MAIVISVGKWGNVYWYSGFGWRLCLGWIAFTYFPIDGDEILEAAAQTADRNIAQGDTE